MTDREFHRKLDHIMSRVVTLDRKIEDCITQLRHMVEASNRNTEALISVLSAVGINTEVDGEDPPEDSMDSKEMPTS